MNVASHHIELVGVDRGEESDQELFDLQPLGPARRRLRRLKYTETGHRQLGIQSGRYTY